MRKKTKFFFAISLLLFGCSQPIENKDVPKQLTNNVLPISSDDLRFWGDRTEDDKFTLVSEKLAMRTSLGSKNERNLLALSGGGSNGAFGAGALAAWSDSGKRPDFDLVTGVSTGAIISVFAYLGSDYDYHIIDFYTNYSDEDLYRKKSLLSVLTSTSVFDVGLYQQLVRDTITPELLASIAEKNKTGKLLLIGTTNLHNQRLSIWNMGNIAAVGTEQSEILFENIILASTAVPGAMPAIQIDVEFEGETYQEIHVDGGVARQVFLLPDSWDLSSIDLSSKTNSLNVYVIRNGEFLPRWEATEMSLTGIASRSFDTIIKYQGRGDVMQIYGQAIEAKANFYFAHIDENFTLSRDPDIQFEKKYMKKLFDYGYKKMADGSLWLNAPPVFNTQVFSTIQE